MKTALGDKKPRVQVLVFSVAATGQQRSNQLRVLAGAPGIVVVIPARARGRQEPEKPILHIVSITSEWSASPPQQANDCRRVPIPCRYLSQNRKDLSIS
jgi:hypothetical protein